MECEHKLQNATKQLSDYALVFDFMAKITTFESEDEVLQSILSLFEMLFMPGVLQYLSFQDGVIHKRNNIKVAQTEGNQNSQTHKKFPTKYSWTESGKGFHVIIQRHNTEFGILKIDELPFPENKTQYLNLVLGVVDVCALAIQNAYRVQKLVDTENSLRAEKVKLEEALSNVKVLTGLLPICSYCKNIKDDSGYWNKIEHYIHEHSDLKFSHSICKNCADELFPDLDLYSE